MSSFKDINASGNIEYHTMTKDNLEYPRVIWTGGNGGYYMSEDQKITINMGEYPTGIQLFWSAYNRSAGTVYNYDFNIFTYVKNSYESEGRGVCILLVPRLNSYVGLKYVYIRETEIVGHSQNITDGTAEHPFFGKLYNKNWVLTKVVAF